MVINVSFGFKNPAFYISQIGKTVTMYWEKWTEAAIVTVYITVRAKPRI